MNKKVDISKKIIQLHQLHRSPKNFGNLADQKYKRNRFDAKPNIQRRQELHINMETPVLQSSTSIKSS